MIQDDEHHAAAGPLRRPVLLGLFVGTGVGAGYLLSGVPNVELITLIAVLAGGALGPGLGFVAGALIATIFSLGNPYGAAMPALLGAQAIGLGLAGLLGGALAPLLMRRKGRPVAFGLLAAGTGAIATLLFDLLTNLASGWTFSLDWRLVLAGAIPFALLHLCGNVAIFALLLPPLLPRCARLKGPPLEGTMHGWLLAGLLLSSASLAQSSAAAVPSGTAPVDSAGTGRQGATGALAPPLGEQAADTLRGQAAGAPLFRWPGTIEARAAPPDTVAAVDTLAAGGGGTPASPDSLVWPSLESSGSETSRPPEAGAPGQGGQLPASAAPPAAPESPWGRRPLWDPFPANLVDLLGRQSVLVAMKDGGFGSPLMLLHLPGTSYQPQFYRDGLPWGTGHRWTDEAWLLPLSGYAVTDGLQTAGPWGHRGGLISLQPLAVAAGQTLTDTRFYKGSHETYLRNIAFLTARVDWRVRFSFEETLDQQGYDFSPPGDARFVGLPGTLGKAKFRSGGGRLVRDYGPGRLALSLEVLRAFKTGSPAFDLHHEEVWGDQAALSWTQVLGGGRLRGDLFWCDRDVQRIPLYASTGDLDLVRKVEVAREATRWGWEDQRLRVQLQVMQWHLHDTGADSSWAGPQGGPLSEQGEEARLRVGRTLTMRGLEGDLELLADHHWRAGWQWGWTGRLGPAGEGDWWDLMISRGGRAPRSDEVLTPDRVYVDERYLAPGQSSLRSLLPNPDLGYERSWLATLHLQGRLWGTDLALQGGVQRLRDGITWTADAGDESRGHWRNDLDLDAGFLVVGAERAGRFAGWARLGAQAAWRTYDVRAGEPVFLAPERSLTAHLLWEHRFFLEDGILEVGYWLQRRGPTDDPWWPGTAVLLDAVTMHDAILAFRLVGTELSLRLHNLTDERQQLSTGALADGREIRYRLHWSFSY
jgi:hypothetical protein